MLKQANRAVADALDSICGVELVLTAACNLRCDYCYQRHHPGKRLSRESLRAALDLVAACDRANVEIGFTGGEPLLEQGLVREGITYAREALDPSSRKPRIYLTTNGTLLGPELSALLAAERVRLRLSLDGVPEAQHRRGSGTFAILDALLDRLHRNQPGWLADAVEVLMTVTAANVSRLADSVAYLLGRRVRAISVGPRLSPDPDWSPALEPELDRQMERARALTLDHYSRTGRVPVTLFRRVAGEQPRRPAAGSCGAGRGDTLVVDVDGRVTACVMFARSYGAVPPTPLGERIGRLDIGHVTDPDLGRRLVEYRKAARATGLFDPISKRHRRCRRCPVRHECLICPAAVAAIPENQDPHAVPPLPCAFNRIVAKHRALFPVQPSIADIIKGRASPLPQLTPP